MEQAMIHITASFWAALPSLISAAILGVLGVIVGQLRAAAKDRKAQYEEQQAHNALSVEAHIATMYDRLENLSAQCVKQGYCDLKMRKNIALMHDVYDRLGGNHGLEAQVKAALRLPNEKE